MQLNYFKKNPTLKSKKTVIFLKKLHFQEVADKVTPYRHTSLLYVQRCFLTLLGRIKTLEG